MTHIPTGQTRDASVVTLGETMALFAPTDSGYLTQGASCRLGLGGAESNVAITLSRLGTPSHWIGRLGTDSFGDVILGQLRAENVAVHAIRDSAPTGLMFKEWAPGGALKVTYRRTSSAGSRLCPTDIAPELVENASILHLTGITPALSTTAAAAVDHAIAVAEAAQITISVDLNYRRALWEPAVARPILTELLGRSSIAFAGADEAALVLGVHQDTPVETLAKQLSRLGPSEVVIKRGPQGAMAYAHGAIHHIQPHPVHSIDPVGAGDAFVGGYLSERTRDETTEQCLETAARVGAYACTVRGDWEGAVHRRDLHLSPTADVVIR
ncbi:sugar kinase [Rhodococcus opacus]|nr:sugar kinase [Rhodococcus opacus]